MKLRDMDPQRKMALLVRVAQLVAFVMLLVGWVFILLWWNR